MLRTPVLLLLILVAAVSAVSAQCPPVTMTLTDGPALEYTLAFESAVPDGAGGFYVAWWNATEVRGYIQRVDGSGTELWTPGGVVFAANGEQRAPHLIAAKDGPAINGVIVCWTHGPYTGPVDLRVQKFDPAGNAIWAAGGLPIGTNNVQEETTRRSLTTDGAGGAILAWQDNGPQVLVKAQRVSSTGLAMWQAGGVVVCSIDQPGTRPTVVTDGTGGAYCVWVDNRPALSQAQCFVQRLAANGSGYWTADGISAATPTGQPVLPPTAQPDGAGGLLLAWPEVISGGFVPVAQRMDSLGNQLWGSSGLALSNVGFLSAPQGEPRVAPDGSGGGVAVWSDDRAGNGLRDVYAQKVTATGALQWAAAGVPIATDVDQELVRGTATDGAGGAHVAYARLANPNDNDIWYQRIDATGNLTLPGAGLLLAGGAADEWPGGLVALDSGDLAIPYGESLNLDIDYKAVILSPSTVVTTAADSGPGSLRAALLAGGTCGLITFAIPGSGPHTIALQSPLPAPGPGRIINARTQPGYAGAPLVQLDGTGLGGAAPGLDLTAGGGVFGLAIWGFPGDAILLGGTAGEVQECHLGVDAAFNVVGNGGAAVAVASGTGHVIRNNAMAGNAGLGIDLAPFGAVNANDPGDADAGANGSQNFPTVELAFGSAAVIRGTLDSTPNTSFDIDVYVSPTCDAFFGHGEGLVYLGATTVVTDGAGFASYSLGVAPAGLSGYLTATATGPDGTSEFSTCGATLETAVGENVVVTPLDAVIGDQPATLEFEVVDTAGTTTLVSGPNGPYLPGYTAGDTARFYEIATTADYAGNINIVMGIDPTPFAGHEEEVRLLHFEAGAWRDVTLRVDAGAGLVYGVVSSLSPFVVALADPVASVGELPEPGAAIFRGTAPNPFNPRTVISFELDRPAEVVLRIYDLKGALVRTLTREPLAAGLHERIWDGTDEYGQRLASGAYLARLQTDRIDEMRKLMLVK